MPSKQPHIPGHLQLPKDSEAKQANNLSIDLLANEEQASLPAQLQP